MRYFLKLLHSSTLFVSLALAFIISSFIVFVVPLFPNVSGNTLYSVLLTIGTALGLVGSFLLFVLHLRVVQRTLLVNAGTEQGGGISIIKRLLLLCVVIMVGLFLVCLFYGLVSVITYNLVFQTTSLQETKSIIDLITQLLTVLVLPLPLVLIAGYTFLGFGLKENIISAFTIFKRAYLYLIGAILLNIGIGYLLWFSTGLIENGIACSLIRAVVFSILGTFWLLVCPALCALVLPKTHGDRITGKPPYISQSLLSQRTKRGIHAVISSCLAIVLSASLSLISPPVFADEMEQNDDNPPTEIIQPEDSNPGVEITSPSEPEAKEPIPYYEEDLPQGEIIAADEQSVIYQTGDRSFTTVIGGTPVVFEDEEGSLQLIDNTLVPVVSEEESYFENASNSYTAKLPATITEEQGISIEKDGCTIEFIPRGGDFSHAMARDNAIRYTEVFPGVDYQYTLVGSLIKEDIVINKQTEQHIFSFEIKTDKELSTIEKDGAIRITNEGTKDPILTVSAPIMEDASGAISDALTLTLEKDDEGRSIVSLFIDENWLAAPDRAYPVRVDPTIDIAPSAVSLVGVEQGAPDIRIGDNGYPYAGYDDGITSGNLATFGAMHMRTRTYVAINYNFSSIMMDAKINSSTFSLHHYTAWSHGNTVFGLFRVENSWDPNTITWNAQLFSNHTAIEYKNANVNPGYINWDVREVVNNWVQGIYPQYGFVVKSQVEGTQEQCEVFSNKASANPPRLVIDWEIPDPVDEAYPLNNTTVNLRPVTEKSIDGKLFFDAVFADGVATPRSTVVYDLMPDNDAGIALASRSYKYPDTTDWQSLFPNGTIYRDKLSNWQSKPYVELAYNKTYRINATAMLDGQVGTERQSDKFLIYQVKQIDTLPSIAKYYGVPLNTLISDNKVQDTLAMEKNTLFIRNPNTEIPYNPPPLSEDKKREIDSALIGRGKHCEYGYEPINLNTGNFWLEAIDVSIPDIKEDFNITRSYNSKDERYQSIFGFGWSFAYSESLSLLEDGTVVNSKGDGKVLYFHPDTFGGYESPEGFNLTLERIPYEVDGVTYYRWAIHESDGATRDFDAWGLLTKITSASGLVTSFSYDKELNIDSITSPSGKAYEFTQDEHGRVTDIKIPGGKSLHYAYDSLGDLISYTDANGNKARYEYDNDHHLVSGYDQNGNRSVHNTYDNEGRVVIQKDALDNSVLLLYGMNQTTAFDALGNMTIYSYDDQYRTTKIQYPDGEVETKSYGSNNTLSSDLKGNYTYDAQGNVTSAISASGLEMQVVYDSFDAPTSIIDADGQETEYSYDTHGNLIGIDYPDGNKEAFVYDKLNRLISHTNQRASTEYFTYDGANVITHTDFNGNTTHYSYNALNQVISVTDSHGETSRIMYDAVGHKTGEQDAAGAYTAYTIDALGLIKTSTDARGYSTSVSYDAAYNIVMVTDPLGNSTSFTYDANHNKLSAINALGYEVDFQYNSRNRLVNASDTEGSSESYVYDCNGNIAQVIDAYGAIKNVEYDQVYNLPIRSTDKLGNTTVLDYSPLGKLTKIINPDLSIRSYSYDEMGRTVLSVDEEGLETALVYSPTGQIVAINEGGHLSSYEYDANGNLITSVDALGGTSTYSYDSENRLISLTDEAVRKTEYTYDPVGRLTSTTDALGNVTQFFYDSVGNLISRTSADGNVTSYSYDAMGHLVSETDALGNTTTYKYDAAENPIATTDSLNQTTNYLYNCKGLLTGYDDPLGQPYRFEYDALGNNTKVTLPNNDNEYMEYDGLGRITKTTDAAGLITSFSYDTRSNIKEFSNNAGKHGEFVYDKAGRLISQTDSLGRKSTYAYDIWGNVLTKTGFDQTINTYTYDALGRVISDTNAKGTRVEYSYNAVGSMTSEKNMKTGAKTTYVYNDLNQLIELKNPLNKVTSFTYDKSGNLIQVIDALGQKQSFSYDAMNRLNVVRDARGNKTYYEYDSLGRPIAVTRAEGDRTEYLYDALDRLVQTKDAEGGITQFAYNAVGDMVKETNALGNSTQYSYDKHGLVTSTTDPLGNQTRFEVALDGTITKITDANGATYNYGYDVLGRVTHIVTPRGYEQVFTYDLAGNISGVSDNLGRTNKYSYDELHNLIVAVDPAGYSKRFSYDSNSNLTRIIDEKGQNTTYTYDVMNRIVGQTDALGKETSYSYDSVGNLTSAVLSGNRSSSYNHDSNGNLTSIKDPNGNTQKYSYDKNNRLVKETNAVGKSTAFEFDSLDRIVKSSDPSGNTTVYSFDAVGNLTSVKNALGNTTSYRYDAASRLIQVKEPGSRTTTIGYDAVGNATSVSDANGNITEYSYDKENNLTQITSPTGAVEKLEYDIAGRVSAATDPRGTTQHYNYDALNRLVEIQYQDEPLKTVNNSYDALGQRTLRSDETGNAEFEYDALGRITKETDGNGRTIAYAYDTSDNLSTIIYPDGTKVTYVYDKAGNLISVSDVSGESIYKYDKQNRPVSLTRPDGSKSTYSYDECGNIKRVKNTDAHGELVSLYEYTYNEKNMIATEEETSVNAEGIEEEFFRTFSYSVNYELVEYSETGENYSATTTYSYDNAGNRKKAIISNNSDPAETVVYSYDADNRLLAKTSSIHGVVAYSYDAAGNLIAKHADGTEEVTYEYSVENRLSAVRQGGQLIMAASYDGDGNRVFQINRYTATEQGYLSGEDDNSKRSDNKELNDITEPEVPEKTGESKKDDSVPTGLLETSGFDIFWYGVSQGILQYSCASIPAALPSASNWLLEVWVPVNEQSNTQKSGISITPSSELTESDINSLYAAGLDEADIAEIAAALASNKGKTHFETENNNATAQIYEYTQTGFELTSYVNSTNMKYTQVLSEYNNQGILKANYTYGISRLSEHNAMEGTGNYLTDGRGSVTGTLALSGGLRDSFAYTPFGEIKNNTSELPFFGYNAEEYNPLTGLQYLRARYYDVGDGRFDVRDTMLGSPGSPLSLNRYLYASANPISNIDPSGHNSIWDAIVGGATTAVNAVTGAANWVNNNVVQPVVNTAKNAAGWVNNNIVQPVGSVVKPAIDWLNTSVISPMRDALNAFVTYIPSAFSSLVATIQGIAGMVANTLGNGISQLLNNPFGFAGSVIKAVNDQIKYFCGVAEHAKSPLDAIIIMKDDVVKFTRDKTADGTFDPVVLPFLNAHRDEETGIITIAEDSWQNAGGYNDLYDKILKAASEFYGGSADSRKYTFVLDGKEYIIWSWKGDYTNLGAGAETGIYKNPILDVQWTAAPEMAVKMELKLETKDKITIYDLKPSEDQWWINGFDPKTPYKKADDLVSTTTYYLADNPEMWNALYNKYSSYKEWTFDSKNKTAVLTW